MTRIAFLGLGAMGARMAQGLLGAGHDVVVYNRTPARAQPLEAAGAVRAETPRAAAARAEVVIAMVTDDDASRTLWLDPDTGAAGGLRDGALAIDSSTLTPGWVEELGAALTGRGVGFLDAPVAGSRPQAEAGGLIFLVGGDAATLERARPTLSPLAAAIHHMGPVGAGAAMKLAVNAIFGIQVAALAEALGMLAKSGIGQEKAIEVLGAMPITSPALKGIAGLMAARAFAPQFPIDLVAKDFRYVVEAAARVNAPVPTSTAVRALYERARDQGHGGDNIAGVVQVFDGNLTARS